MAVGTDRLGGIAVSPAIRRMLAGMDKWTPTLADIPTGDTRPVKTPKPVSGRFFNRHGPGSRAKQEKYLAQRRLRGLGDALLGSGDLANMAINAGIADFNLLTGGLGGKRDVELPMPSQATADLLTDITGTKIVPDEEVSPEIRKEGANQRALMGAIPTGAEDVIPSGAALAGVVSSGKKLAKGLGEAAEHLPNVEKTASAVVDPVAPQGLGIRAYHGSPHSFEEFDISKIGTGEGAQAYGHGLYFAENEDVARGYRERLAGTKANEGTVEGAVERALAEDNPREWLEGQSRSATNALKRYPDNQYLVEQAQRYDDAIKLLEGGYKPAGSMYEVDIAADPEAFLDWDKPLSEQPHINRLLREKGLLQGDIEADMRAELSRRSRSEDEPVALQKMYEELRAAAKNADDDALEKIWDQQAIIEKWWDEGVSKGSALDPTGETVHRQISERLTNAPNIMGSRNQDAASQQLKQAGIPGIRYLDQGSRVSPLDLETARSDLKHWEKQIADYGYNSAWTPEGLASVRQKVTDLEAKAAKGSRNYVVFDPKLISIVKKYGLAAAISAGLISEEMGRQMQEQGEL